MLRAKAAMNVSRTACVVALSMIAMAAPASAAPHGVHTHAHPASGARFFPHHRSIVVFAPVPFFVAPSIVYASPPVYYAPPPVVYAPQPAYYAPPPPPMPRVVEFSTGRYELRGNGVTTPYVWVWIPNPPTAPPPPPASPPAPAAPPDANSDPPRGSERRAPGRLYRFTDERGVTTWTDSLLKVPERFRMQAAKTALPD
jgi:hypothetical protein